MKNLLAGLLLLAGLASLYMAGYFGGRGVSDRAWQAKEQQRLQAEAIARESEIRRGEKASGALQAELLQRQIDQEQLTRAFDAYKRRHPILARDQVRPAAAGAAPTDASALACDAAPGGSSPALSLGAVWMWNSALEGRDVPAGACGLADSSEGACAADSGVGLEDAWDNQALNAGICAEDRIRHQRLIDYITGKTK